MTAEPETSVEDVKRAATAAGLQLSDDEAAALLPGVRRMRSMAAALRRIGVGPQLEPAPVFDAGAGPKAEA